MTHSLKSTRVVAAIDFGTSRSGFAYSFTVDKKVIGWTDWPGQSTAYPKTLTQLLYGPDHDVIAWGHLAPQRLAELRRESNPRDYELFRNFKMDLHRESRRTNHGPPGTGRGVVDLISDYLRVMKDLAWEVFCESTAGHLRQDEVLWCLTVPAIWTDVEKHQMRLAARNAGLIGSEPADAERLLLVLEPEAAAIHCQEWDRHALTEGGRFMVVDCGGGTVDITSHEMVKGQGLREVAPGTGGALGSTYVDRVFLERVLEEKLSADLLNTYREQEPLEFLRMMDDWERLKCNFDPETVLGASCLPFQPRLYRLLVTRFASVYDKLVEEGHDDGIYLEPDEFEAVFAPILDQIVDKIREQLDRMGSGGCDVLYMVGGFSTSPLLARRIRSEFDSDIGKIVVPPVPGAAVVEGAVSFGLDPSLIRSRRSRLTYGCGCDMDFEPGQDHELRKYWSAEFEKWHCAGRFHSYVAAGDVVEVDQRVTASFMPVTPDQTELNFEFFASGKERVRYIDELGVEKVGSCRIQMPDTTKGLDREVEVSMYFGKTEIEVKAVDLTTGKRYESSLDFSSSFSSDLAGESR